MKKQMNVLILTILSIALVGCAAMANDWPDRTDRTPEQMLTDLIRWQQRKHIRTSTGVQAYQCFTEVEYQEFKKANRPREIVDRLRKAQDFKIIASALRTLPAEQLVAGLERARWIARPTWRQMGFIDPEGRGQTEAGHQAELMIASTIVDAFEEELTSDSPHTLQGSGKPLLRQDNRLPVDKLM